jgi:hypothetical protein
MIAFSLPGTYSDSENMSNSPEAEPLTLQPHPGASPAIELHTEPRPDIPSPHPFRTRWRHGIQYGPPPNAQRLVRYKAPPEQQSRQSRDGVEGSAPGPDGQESHGHYDSHQPMTPTHDPGTPSGHSSLVPSPTPSLPSPSPIPSTLGSVPQQSVDDSRGSSRYLQRNNAMRSTGGRSFTPVSTQPPREAYVPLMARPHSSTVPHRSWTSWSRYRGDQSEGAGNKGCDCGQWCCYLCIGCLELPFK